MPDRCSRCQGPLNQWGLCAAYCRLQQSPEDAWRSVMRLARERASKRALVGLPAPSPLAELDVHLLADSLDDKLQRLMATVESERHEAEVSMQAIIGAVFEVEKFTIAMRQRSTARFSAAMLAAMLFGAFVALWSYHGHLSVLAPMHLDSLRLDQFNRYKR